MQTISVDQSKNPRIRYRKSEGIPLSFHFFQDSGGFDITAYEFLFEVFDMRTGALVFSLTEDTDGGLVNNGSTGILQMTPSDANVEIDEKSYFYKLKVIDPATRTWFNGLFVVNDSPIIDEEDDTVNVQLDIGDVVVEVSLTGILLSGDSILAALTDENIGELYQLLLPYISGEVIPGGPSDYIGTLYTRLIPYITGEA